MTVFMSCGLLEGTNTIKFHGLLCLWHIITQLHITQLLLDSQALGYGWSKSQPFISLCIIKQKEKKNFKNTNFFFFLNFFFL